MNRMAAALALIMSVVAVPAVAGARVTLPFEQANLNIYVQATVAHSEPLWFLLDTGAKPAVVDLGVADELGLARGDSVAVSGGGDHPVMGYLLKDSPFQLTGLEGFSQPLLLALPLDDLSKASGRRIAGILGYDFISQFVVEIDYTRHTLTLDDRTSWVYRGKGESLPITFNAAGHPQVRAQLLDDDRAPIAGTFVIDLGSGAAVILNRPFVEEQGFLAGGRKTVPWLEGLALGGHIAGSVGRVQALELGRFRIQNPVVVFSEAGSGPFASADTQGNIGAAILEKFKVILDYERMRIILEPNATFGEPLDYNRSGLWLMAAGGDFRTYTVEGIAAGSPAAQAGLAVGDTLTSVDGHPAGVRSLSDIRLLLQHAERCTLAIRRGDRRQQVTLLLRSPV